MTSRESCADLRGERLTRDKRKSLRIADLRECTPERRAEIRAKAESIIRYHAQCRDTQRANGIPVSDVQHARNIATHVLTIECLDAISE